MPKASILLICPLLLTVAVAGGQQTPASIPVGAFANVNDYTFMWWTNGLRDPGADFSIQTSRFALTFNVPKLELTHLVPRPTARSESEALTQDNRRIFGRPNASLACTLVTAGQRYRVTGASAGHDNLRGDCQLIESGKFFQRRLMTGLSWQDGAPAVEGEFEVAAWPDRLLLMLRIVPRHEIPTASLELTLDLDTIFTGTAARGTVYGVTAADGSGYVARAADNDSRLSCDKDRGVLSVRTGPAYLAAGQQATVRLVLFPTAEKPSKLLDCIVVSDREPIRIRAQQIAPKKRDLQVTYDRALGWHFVALSNDGNVRDYSQTSNDRIERVLLCLDNPSAFPRQVRLNFGKHHRVFGITGLSAILCDGAGNPTGIPIQISKNWHGKAANRYNGPWYHGLTMLTVPARSRLTVQYVSVNAHWGGVPAASHAQLCLVGWGNHQLWDEAAVGSWGESICFEPDQGQIGGAVLDTRPLMITRLKPAGKNTRWGWTCNVGGADFLVYYPAARSQKVWNSRMKTMYRRYSPVLTEVTYAGRSHDAKIDLRYTVSLYRTDDLTRGIYRFRYDVRQPVDFRRLVLFQCGGDHYSYTGERSMALGNERGLARQWKTQWGGNRYRTQPVELTGRVPWISMHDAVPRELGGWANRGLIVREFESRIQGRRTKPWVAERGARVRGSDTSLIDILPPPGVNRLLVGDYVEAVVEHVVIPQWAKDYYGPNGRLTAALQESQNTWKMVFREAVGNHLEVSVSRGTLRRARPLMIEAQDNHAQFSIAGGLGYVPITISGLTKYGPPVLQKQSGNRWETIDQSVHGSDFWQADYDPSTMTWEITYSIPLDSPDDRRKTRNFRFSFGTT